MHSQLVVIHSTMFDNSSLPHACKKQCEKNDNSFFKVSFFFLSLYFLAEQLFKKPKQKPLGYNTTQHLNQQQIH